VVVLAGGAPRAATAREAALVGGIPLLVSPAMWRGVESLQIEYSNLAIYYTCPVQTY
jgi:hypothetical protein